MGHRCASCGNTVVVTIKSVVCHSCSGLDEHEDIIFGSQLKQLIERWRQREQEHEQKFEDTQVGTYAAGWQAAAWATNLACASELEKLLGGGDTT